MKTSKAGLDLIKAFEGFRSHPYLCPAGIPTIGYGATFYQILPLIKVTMHDPAITKDRAEALLVTTLKTFEEAVKKALIVDVTQNQFDALVSFTFNLGPESLRSSALLKKVNAKDFIGAAPEFAKWNKARVNGALTPLAGLTRRRAAERTLFETK